MNHRILLKKLKLYGIRGNSLQLFNSYLSNRRQYVKIGNYSYNSKLIESGVLQGSILGPILFLVFINDLPNISDKFTTVLYADDTTISFSNKCFHSLVSICNSELVKFNDWCISNKLTINSNKLFI